MNKIVLLAGLAMSLCASPDSQAQVHINVQIGAPVVQQPWYANDNDYYYMPEQGVYYNVRRKVYVYPEGGKWLYADRLPSRFGNYSYRNSHYVRVRDRSPFDRDNDYRQRYHSNNGGDHNDHRNGQGNHDNHDRGRDNNGDDHHGR